MKLNYINKKYIYSNLFEISFKTDEDLGIDLSDLTNCVTSYEVDEETKSIKIAFSLPEDIPMSYFEYIKTIDLSIHDKTGEVLTKFNWDVHNHYKKFSGDYNSFRDLAIVVKFIVYEN